MVRIINDFNKKANNNDNKPKVVIRNCVSYYNGNTIGWLTYLIKTGGWVSGMREEYPKKEFASTIE